MISARAGLYLVFKPLRQISTSVEVVQDSFIYISLYMNIL